MEKGSQLINIEDLKLDPHNPRLPNKYIGITDETKVIDYLLKTGNIIELMKSISETGYSDAEPLLVVKDSDDKYIVIEGNRRLAAVKLLNMPHLAKVKLSSIEEVIGDAKTIPVEIPVLEYEKRTEILNYLGYRHITGVKDWGALEKARYLNELYKLHVESCGVDNIYSVLAKMIGSKANYVQKLHQALTLYLYANDEIYFGSGLDEEEISFSFLTTALGYTSIVEYIELKSIDQFDYTKYKDVFLWLFDKNNKVISDSREISDLAKIVSYPSAVENLKINCNISEALLYTNDAEITFVKMLTKAKQQLLSAKTIIEKLGQEPKEGIELLEDIDKLTKSINGAIKENFRKDVFKDVTPEQLEAIKKILHEKNEQKV